MVTISTPESRQVAARIGGLGCLVAFVLLDLMSRLPFADYDLAFAQQLPLTLSGDLGCMAALLLILASSRREKPSAAASGFAAAAVLAGLVLALLIKGGILAGASTAALVVGDALVGFFLMLCAFSWWLVLAKMPTTNAAETFAAALALGTVLFLAANALPPELGRVVVPIALVSIMGLCYWQILAATAADGTSENAEARETAPASTNAVTPADSSDSESAWAIGSASDSLGWIVPRPIAAVLVLAFFVVDFELDLFPISLYFEDMAYGSMPTPAAFCSCLILVFAGALFLAARRGTLSLSPLYTAGFLLTALEYLLTPYRLQGGFALAAGEAGRLIVFAFAGLMALRLLGTPTSMRRAQALFGQFGILMFGTMLAADVVVVVMQLQEGFDYGDFTFRTLFASCGIAVLVVLLIGPLPRIRSLLEPDGAAQPTSVGTVAGTNGTAKTAPVAATPVVDMHTVLEERCSQFASSYKLTSRETDILRLIAAGRDVPYIEQELVLAKSTVKTHIKHIYEKCGVSSRQALLDLIEAF